MTGESVLLFDFFGTLVEYQPDRSRLAYPASHRLAVQLGYGRGHDAFVTDWDAASSGLESASAVSHLEFSMSDAARMFAVRCDLEVTVAEIDEMGATFVQEWHQHITPVPGVAELLCTLGDRHRLGVVSNTHDPHMVPSMLRSLGVLDTMSVVMLSIDHGARKPHPSIYASTLALLDVDARDVCFVGDSFIADYEAPRRLGMRSILVSSTPDDRVPECDRVASVTDLAALLDGGG